MSSHISQVIKVVNSPKIMYFDGMNSQIVMGDWNLVILSTDTFFDMKFHVANATSNLQFVVTTGFNRMLAYFYAKNMQSVPISC